MFLIKLPFLSRLAKSFMCLLFCFVVSGLSYAQSEVSFSVEMKYANYQPGDKVVVRGNIPELGNWQQEGELVLNSESLSSNTFEGKVEINESDTEFILFYKFLILKQDGREIWEDRVNRSLVLNKSRNVLKPVYFSDRDSPGLTPLLTELNFVLDVRDFFISGEKPERVAVLGNRGSLTFDINSTILAMKEVSNGIWQAKIDLPVKTSRDLEFKFAWFINGKWEWEYLPGHINHVAWLDQNKPNQTIAMVYIPSTGRILPQSGQPHVDSYPLLKEELGEAFWVTNYSYGHAVKLLHENNRLEAENTYQKFKRNKFEDDGIDDFYYEYAALIHNEEGLEGSINFIKSKQRDEEISEERKAYLEYLIGERYMHESNHVKARLHFKEVINKYDIEQPAFEYSKDGLKLSYLSDSNIDSIKHGINLINRNLYNDTTKTPSMLRYLALTHKKLDNKQELEQTLWKMTQIGSSSERAQASIRLAQKQLNEERLKESLNTLSQIDSSQVSLSLTESKDFMEYRIFKRMGDKEKANTLERRLREKYSGSKKLEGLIDNKSGKE